MSRNSCWYSCSARRQYSMRACGVRCLYANACWAGDGVRCGAVRQGGKNVQSKGFERHGRHISGQLVGKPPLPQPVMKLRAYSARVPPSQSLIVTSA